MRSLPFLALSFGLLLSTNHVRAQFSPVRPPTWRLEMENPPPDPPAGCSWFGADKILLCPGTFNSSRPARCPSGWEICKEITSPEATRLCRTNLGGFFAADVPLAPSATGGVDEAVCAVPGSGIISGWAGCGIRPSRGYNALLDTPCGGFQQGIFCDPQPTYPTGWGCEPWPINTNPRDGVMCCSINPWRGL